MNNEVKDSQGKTVGFRCWECGDIVSSMWGEHCNKCREKERRHQELLKAIKEKKQ